MKLWCNLIFVLGIVFSLMAITARADSDLWDDDDNKDVVRISRGIKEQASGGKKSACKYEKEEWSECDPKTNTRSRKMSLKTKSASSTCEPVKVVQKKCKKAACRYVKGSFSSCVNSQMTRIDNIKPNSDPTCEPTRKIEKKCKSDPNATKSAKKGNKKNNKQ
ncbi:uncharacterized protein LOC122857084 isoform X1 [Aphidius gifuensis]|uniref:uncharacterized protein LOC122857084 isoform X1 n=1 Tax=Aphidius gifuensis TaxID=684658 RepID=UPI001CDB67FB|nr:uncharacterized protein LOC122857084 isoform X1 [Aphidius gifuensis]XP_044015002.1 uncharacterized protein LOC122857084 isoform X1 [Aphidius gifuensis]XP_044015003.1 uncharacterized protein LOC122857084 isoform X1 [Aphidius gifuensis]